MKVTNDDTRDVAIRVLEYLIDNEYITETEDFTEDPWGFDIQDFIHDEINNLLNIEVDLRESVIIKHITK